MNFKDCKSCFACKAKGNKTNGICAIRDDLRPVLEKIHEANAVVIGSPAYYGDLTGEAFSVIHRMLFAPMHYEDDGSRDELLPVKKKCGLIVTMNATEDMIRKGYDRYFQNTADMIGMVFGRCETLYACDTYQFDDYSKPSRNRRSG
ncbi:MAG: NAD(P)H-dependent oxidoreductase [Roseburia sp.]|nr:NAD(P)H-dependent oxidoreductase [Roseburia sp.]